MLCNSKYFINSYLKYNFYSMKYIDKKINLSIQLPSTFFSTNIHKQSTI